MPDLRRRAAIAVMSLGALGAVALALPSAALAATRTAILSLIGDSMTLVTYSASVGSRLDRNIREPIPLTEPVFDRTAVRAIAGALKKADPQAETILLGGSAPELFRDQRRLFDGSRLVLGEDLHASLRSEGATRLILVTKHRAEAKLGTTWTAGSGYLEGLGFYIDRQLLTDAARTGEQSVGFMAPYVYIKASLVDLATGNVVREEAITASRMITVDRTVSLDPWTAMDADRKAGMLRELIAGELERVVPLLVSSRG